MKTKFFENNFFIVTLVILGIIFLHYIKILQPVEQLMTIIFSPFQTFISSASSQTSVEVSKFVSHRDLSNENEKLKNKINKLEQKIVELQIFIEENDLLIKQNKYLVFQGFNFVNARVIASGSQHNPNLIIINRGSSDGVAKGMAVVAEQGSLAGKIIQVENEKSEVLLLLDNSIRLSAVVAGNSDIVGLVEGKNNNSISLNQVLKNAELNFGDLLITSGFDKNMPSGLLIGEIEEIFDKPEDLFKSAKVNSPVNFKNLRIVSVVLE